MAAIVVRNVVTTCPLASLAARDSFHHDRNPHRSRQTLLREQVASGQFSSVDSAVDSAVEAAIQTVFGHRASLALESLLNEALLNPGRRVPVSELRRN